MTGFTLAPAARDDLSDIADYIALDSRASAHRVVDAIFMAFDRLADQPGIGHLRSDLTDRPVRFWTLMGRYSIVYRTQPSAPIEIVRVFGPGRDIFSALR